MSNEAKKITELDAVQLLQESAKALIVQSESSVDSARLATMTQLANVIKSILALDSNYAPRSLITDVENKGDGLELVDDTLYLTSDGVPISDGIPIASSSGLAFDEIYMEDGYLHIANEGEDVVDPCYIGSGGGGGGTTVIIRNRMGSKSLTIAEPQTELDILFTATSTDEDDELTLSWVVNGSKVAVQTGVEQGEGSFDVRQYLTTGIMNTVRLTAEDSYGSSKSFTWQVTVASYNLKWSLDEIGYHGSSMLDIPIEVNGIGDKTVKLTVDGVLKYNSVVATTGRKITVTVAAQTHGSHVIEAWMETEVDGVTVETDPLRHVGIWTVAGTNTPVVALLDTALTVQQYATTPVRFMVYDPTSETTTIIKSVDAEPTSTEIVPRTIQTWAFRPNETGTHTLTISCGTASATCTLTVTSSGYDIEPVTRGLVVHLDPTGHSNTEINRDQFGYTDDEDTNHPLTFSSNFDWSSGGFQRDADGITALVMKRGTYVELDRSLFNDDAKTNGKEIKIVFKATECRDYDAQIATCYANGIGIQLLAQQGSLSSELNGMTVQYCEEKKIEMDINIEASNEDKLAIIWLEGVPARAVAYSSNDIWRQSTSQKLRIGSDDCDVWLYGLKMYAASLTRNEILQNFIADCADTNEMIDRYERNDIFNLNGTINETKLAEVKPELRVIHISAPRLTESKTDEVLCDVSLTYTNGGDDYGFDATGVIMKAQGTSSLEYGLAALNLDIDFKNAASWQDKNGNDITAYAMSEHAIPVNYLNLKVNVASSENANNVCMADDYNTFQPYKKYARNKNEEDETATAYVRDCIEGHPAAIFFTNTSGAAIQVGSRTVQAGETILYAVGDLCNSKKNLAVFGMGTDPEHNGEQFCVEIHNNNTLQCRFKSDDLTNETWDGGDDASFDVRYPKNPTAANKATWQAVLSWVVSTDVEAATGESLLTPVTYNGTTYTKDNAAFRKAKFKAELADHFAVDSLLYHYLTTVRRLLPDNRSKNTFYEYDYDEEAGKYLWNIVHGYDFDTMSGNDNSGGLTFTYGMEDTDMVGSSYVFNAHDNVLWCNLRDTFGTELEAMYRTCESAGAWSKDRILAKWKAYRDCRPEALLVEDMWNKYFSPFINSNENRYIRAMLGTKEDQLIQFETYQEPYMSAKYNGTVNDSDKISFRINNPASYGTIVPSGDINDIVPYADTYIRVKYGNAGSVKIRAKRGESYDVEAPAGISPNDLEFYIYGAGSIASVGSFAALYSRLFELSAAKKLQQAIIGDGAQDYENSSLESLSFGNNVLLRKIDLRGTTALVQDMDLSGLKSLEEIYTENSAITGITFAPGCPLETAELNALRQLSAADLADLETFSMDADNLTSLRVENCPAIDTLSLVESATNLQRGRIVGVNWTLDSARTLKRLMGMSGFDAAGEETSKFVLTGNVRVGLITQIDLTAIRQYFGAGLVVTADDILQSFTVTFKNYDGTVLDTQSVGYGTAPEEPDIEDPTRPDDAGYTYVWDGWSSNNGYGKIADLSAVAITADTVIWAFYIPTAKTYTVTWKNGNTVKDTQSAAYGSSVSYSGSAFSYPGIDGNNGKWHLFAGWDKSTGFITEDLVVNAVYTEAEVPSGKALSAMSPTEIHALAESNGLAAAVSSGDTIDIVAGRDGDYLNIPAHVLIDYDDPVLYDGTTDLMPMVDGEYVKLFDSDKSWTLAIDFAFDTTTTTSGCLVTCAQGDDGFALKYNAGGRVQFGQSATQQVSTNGVREICILRKNKGSARLHVYASNKNSLDGVVYTALQLASVPISNAPLTFGAHGYDDLTTDSPGKGMIYWAKLWDSALSDAECRELASWPRQTFKMQAVGTAQHEFHSFRRPSSDGGTFANCTFLLKELLEETHVWNLTRTNTGGWKACHLRAYLNDRIFKALPTEWQSMILTVVVKSSDGDKSQELTDPAAEDKIWIPCVKEMGSNTSTVPYSLEGETPFTVFTDNASRIKRLNFGTGAASAWQLRSPVDNDTAYRWYCTVSGAVSNEWNAAREPNNPTGVAFGFCV